MASPDQPATRRVLVIDDNVDAAEMLSVLLELNGHVVASANGGSDGLASAATFLPDVVFLDLGMPGMDGYAVAPALRGIAGLENVWLVALTGWNDKAAQARMREVGFDAHLTKPASIEAIEQQVARARAHAAPAQARPARVSVRTA